MALLRRIVQIILLWLLAAATEAASQALPNCKSNCGNLNIPYPFGTTKECCLDGNFLITCNEASNHAEAFLMKTTIPVTNISIEGQLEISQYVARDCYEPSGQRSANTRTSLWVPMFTISDAKNKFTAVGCDTYAKLQGQRGDGDGTYTTGCISECTSRINNGTISVDGSCSGIGCCEISIPSGLKNISVTIGSFNNHTGILDFNPCSFAFVVDPSKFEFSWNSFDDLMNYTYLPLVLDWTIGNKPCQAGNVCKKNSECYEPRNASGYSCKCKDGYQGNPYHPDGCRDTDECVDSSLNQCEYKERCENTLGNYTCSCPDGYRGDGKKDGEGCVANRIKVMEMAIGIGIGFIVLIVGSSSLYIMYKKRRLTKLKAQFFRQNGGYMLREQLRSREASTDMIKIFSKEDLEEATNNYEEIRIIGRGGYGTVYKGILKDSRVVAIKKSKIVDQSQIDQFINEVFVLSQINHRNVVKLLGCCLETEVPLLVYEFVTNGTLFDHIHDDSKASVISWETRVRIAAETAGVLSYLHSAASTPIIHRDVKPTNILLDDNYTAKVSDFGASRLVPVDQTQLSTMVQGTLGYLDPEYLHTSQLTEKSDVYSFGVVLVELLTGKKALSFDRPEEERSLVKYFLSLLKDKQFCRLPDDRVASDGVIEQLGEVAELAKRCLRVKGEERPTMKEVAMELEGLRVTMEKHPWVKVEVNTEETEHLLGGSSSAFGIGDCDNTSAGYDSLRNQVLLTIDDGR